MGQTLTIKSIQSHNRFHTSWNVYSSSHKEGTIFCQMRLGWAYDFFWLVDSGISGNYIQEWRPKASMKQSHRSPQENEKRWNVMVSSHGGVCCALGITWSKALAQKEQSRYLSRDHPLPWTFLLVCKAWNSKCHTWHLENGHQGHNYRPVAAVSSFNFCFTCFENT